MVRRFNSDAAQVRAAYLSSLLVALYEEVRAALASLRQAAESETPAVPPLPQAVPSSFGRL